MNEITLPQTRDKHLGKLSFLIWIWQPIKEKENFELKPVVDLDRNGLSKNLPVQDTYDKGSPTD